MPLVLVVGVPPKDCTSKVYGVLAVLILYTLAPAPANKVLAPVALIYSPNDLTINVLAVLLSDILSVTCLIPSLVVTRPFSSNIILLAVVRNCGGKLEADDCLFNP